MEAHLQAHARSNIHPQTHPHRSLVLRGERDLVDHDNDGQQASQDLCAFFHRPPRILITVQEGRKNYIFLTFSLLMTLLSQVGWRQEIQLERQDQLDLQVDGRGRMVEQKLERWKEASCYFFSLSDMLLTMKMVKHNLRKTGKMEQRIRQE